MSLTYSCLGISMGNLGNQLFQIASCVGLARKYNTRLTFPEWKYSQYFLNPLSEFEPKQSNIDEIISLTEPSYNYTPEWWDAYREQFESDNKLVDIRGWLQSEKYFEKYQDEIKKVFEFKSTFIQEVCSKAPLFDADKETIAISIRRGDYVGNPNYYLLNVNYYILALDFNFPDWRTKYNLLFFSDDMGYCHTHFDCLPNAYFADGLNDIEQLCLGSLCDHFIISNSTFAWWMAWLGEKPNSKIIRPAFHFAGRLLQQSDWSDYYPARWTQYNHETERVNLMDVTFTIPVSCDSEDRKDNLDICVGMLQETFLTNIIIGEQGTNRFHTYHSRNCIYHHFNDMKLFHRTKMLNDMALMSKTQIIVNLDADLVIPPMQLIEAVRLIKDGKAQMVYPFDGRFARVPRGQWNITMHDFMDVGMFSDKPFRGMIGDYIPSVGGVIAWDVEAFVQGGMENEHMISYAPEDTERFERYQKLGYKVERIKGVVYHFDHLITENSSTAHEYFQDNMREYNKVHHMTEPELRDYVETWPWKKRYMPMYYESIHEEAVRSRDEVFEILTDLGAIDEDTKIVDVCCGLGSWGIGLKNYVGIDFGVPKEKLVIPESQYVDQDIREPFHDEVNKFDLVLCLEGLEHIEEKYADGVIGRLCQLGDTILFSAAIPGQGGVNHHNEQWQSYWAKKFVVHGYYPIALDIRKELRDNENVGIWYRNNMIIYRKGTAWIPNYQLDFIHPKLYTNILKHHKIL